MSEVQANASLQLTMNAQDNASSVISSVSNVVNGLQNVLGAAGLAAIGAFAASIEPTLQYAETLGRVKSIAGLTANETARLLAGFGAAGIGADDAAPMIQRLEMRLGRLADQAANATKAGNTSTRMFEDLGIKVRDAHGKAIPMGELLPQIIDHLNAIQDPMLKASISSQLFGKNYGSLAPLLALGGAGFKAAMDDASRFGLEIGEHGVEEGHKFREEQTKMNEALLGLKVMLGLYIIPFLTQLFQWVENLIAGFQALAPPIKEMIVHLLGLVAVFGTLLGGAAAVGGALRTVSTVLGPLGVAITTLSAPMLAFLGVIGAIIAVVLAAAYAYNNFAAVHRALAPIVDALTHLWQNLGNAISFFVSSLAVIGPINALGGSLRILGASTSTVIGLTNTLTGWWNQIATVLNRVKEALMIGLGVWNTSHDVLAAVVSILDSLGVSFTTIDNMLATGRLIWATLSNDWRQLASSLGPALQRAGVNLGATFQSLGGVIRTLTPVVLAIAGALGVAFQIIIQVLIVALPPAIELVSGLLRALAGGLEIVANFVTQNHTVLTILAGVIATVLMPTLIALGIQFTVNLVRGLIATIEQVTASTVAWVAQNAQMIINNVQLSAYLVRMAAVAVAQGVVRAATMAWTAMQWLLNLALDANPIGLVVLAIAALVIGIIYAYQHSETFRNIVNQLWAGMQSFGGWLNNSLRPVLDWLAGAFQQIAHWAGQAMSAIGNVTNSAGAVSGALHVIGLQHGALVGPSYGGARLAAVGEGKEDEVVATMSQVMAAGARAGAGGGGEPTVIPITLTLDGAVLSRVVLERAGKRWSLQAGRIGSGA